MFDFGSDLRSERRSMDSDEVGPELNDFSNGLGSRWCLAVERTGEFLDSGFAGGLEAVAGRADWRAIMVVMVAEPNQEEEQKQVSEMERRDDG